MLCVVDSLVPTVQYKQVDEETEREERESGLCCCCCWRLPVRPDVDNLHGVADGSDTAAAERHGYSKVHVGGVGGIMRLTMMVIQLLSRSQIDRARALSFCY